VGGIADENWLSVQGGVASYYNIVLSSGEIFRDVVWWYPTTVVEASALRGFVAFYDEKIDVWIDDEKQERGPIPEMYATK
jgi:uncharacterized protein (DUF427 family)